VFCARLKKTFQAYTTQAWQHRWNVKRYLDSEDFKHAKKDI
jgi:hypothetical protein